MNLEKLIREKYGSNVKIEKMPGDASDRSFFRIKKEKGSLVLMKHAYPFKEAELPYINIWHFLKSQSFPVPQILQIDPAQGILILSDLGDELLQNDVLRLKEEKNEEKIIDWYKKGIEIIVDLQLTGTPSLNESCMASQCSLDKERFLYELNFFYNHYAKGLLTLDLKIDEEDEILNWFDKLAEDSSSFGRVLCHRDFHSRNLLIVDDELYMTDFQDARLGPYTYDLASFLKDSYVSFSDAFVDDMLDFYLSLLRKKAAHKALSKDMDRNPFLQQLPSGDNQEKRAKFRREFDLTCIQRNIKAIGTFAYQSHVKKNHYYLQYIPLTLNYVKANLKKLNIEIPSINLILDKPAPKGNKL